MKAMHYIGLSVLTVLATVCSGCADTGIVTESGGIYGTVTDFATGEPVMDAAVQLRPGGETTLTGSDGRYEFIDLDRGDYSITVSKAEYTDLVDDYVITVDTKMMRRDVQIKKIPAYLQVVDNDLNPITFLDFGTDATSMQFVIFNSGPVSLECEIVHSCAWISDITEVSNPIASGATCPVVITIDRSRLAAGVNTDYVHVTSNNGNKQIEISAVGKTVIPEVVTLPVTNTDGSVTPWCNTFHAEIAKVGNPPYYQRGFCFSDINDMPAEDDNCVTVSGTEGNTYSYTYWDFPSVTARYYVRAWLKYGDGQIVYGNVQSFVYNDVL